MLLAACAIPAAHAHFQLLYTPQAALQEAAAVPLALVFSHPFDNGITMPMGRPEAFYVVHQRGDGGRTRRLHAVAELSGLERMVRGAPPGVFQASRPFWRSSICATSIFLSKPGPG